MVVGGDQSSTNASSLFFFTAGNSTMIGVMGRMCTYTGQTLTWDDCVNSQEKLGPSHYAWNDEVPKVAVPVPGATKLV